MTLQIPALRQIKLKIPVPGNHQTDIRIFVCNMPERMNQIVQPFNLVQTTDKQNYAAISYIFIFVET